MYTFTISFDLIGTESSCIHSLLNVIFELFIPLSVIIGLIIECGFNNASYKPLDFQLTIWLWLFTLVCLNTKIMVDTLKNSVYHYY